MNILLKLVASVEIHYTRLYLFHMQPNIPITVFLPHPGAIIPKCTKTAIKLLVLMVKCLGF